MTCTFSAEDTNRHFGEGSSHPPIDDLEGAWVNADSPSERYTVEGHHVTRTDVRGIHHFTLHWDSHRRRWKWGTHGRLSLEWHANDVISWVPDTHAQHDKVWHWRRCCPSPSKSAAVPCPIVPTSSSYAPACRQRSSSHHTWSAHPYAAPSSSWSASSAVVPPRSSFAGSPSSRIEPAQMNWDFEYSSPSFHRHCHPSDSRYRREHRNWDHHGYGPLRGRGGDFWCSGLTMPCGLTNGEVSDLLTREITPEDYDLLLRLDKLIAKPTASADSIERLASVHKDDFMGGECSVCLCSFDKDDAVAALPCNHHFHRSCVTKWLAECRNKCPLCGIEVPTEERASDN